ncbi:phage major capsid protein [Streptococcus pneumoniae]|uniref:phage major capsid protein n=1 Tax=Streptococcus pneumoniae TaxID=1313 RepID=UPI000766B97E|nr:phage major capsid protein [Streptococcus pneumoniae]CWH10311.1 Capsid protein [Streptococcus pneumoniae]CWI06464.1 Capsid protein [Streptococcus pneumoniae]HES9493497.1 phage major capsid protein [Streptococcus pneumoniae]
MAKKFSLVEKYVRSRGMGIGDKKSKTGLILSKDIISIYDVPEEGKELVDFVNVIEHAGTGGTYETVGFSDEHLSELESEEFRESENVELRKKKIKTKFEHKTFSGSIPLSSEQVDDGEYNILDFLSNKITRLCRKTRNIEIGKILKEAPEKNVSNFDELKDIINDLTPERHNTLVLSQSLFKFLDKEKSSDGNYILKINKKERYSENLYVDDIIIVSDEILGVKGDKVAFVGDLYNFATLFERDKNSLRWVDESVIYGMSLILYTRFVVKKIETDCAFFIKWN